MATYSSTFAWRNPWTEEPGRLQSLGSQESDMTERLSPQDHLQLFSASLHSQRHPQVQRPLLLSLFSCQDVSAPFVTWTVARQAPLSMRFPKQEYWSGLPFSPLGGLPDPGLSVSGISCIGRWILYLWTTWESPSLISNCLNLSFRTQGRLWRLNEAYFL